VFQKVLIANRGEVALRINATLLKLGIASVGIYTNHDRGSLHVTEIDECLLISDSVQSGYLNGQAIIAAAIASGAQAIHPGYGFLAESAEFAQACSDAGLIFIGPPAPAIAAMGEKISAREYAIRAGVPIAPGVSAPNMTNSDLLEACRDLVFPLLVKPAAGGGGKGLHIASTLRELEDVLPVARREAKSSFGDDALFVEKFLPHARHIEFQVAADNFGNTLHLGERECSLQRRHQKVIEEAPAPTLTATQRAIMGGAALKLTSAIGYQNLGTIEFLVDADSPEIFYFMEMNTRLQVEHRVTELITGLDLVECQLRLASGERLPDVIPEVRLEGHAIEARIYAEDSYNHFLPTGGFVGKFAAVDQPHTVTDSSIADGTFVSSAFDPMLAKVACWGDDRSMALKRLREALSHTVLFGVTTNIDFLIKILNSQDIIDSNYDSKYLEGLKIDRPTPSTEVLSAYAASATSLGSATWTKDGWRLSGMPKATVTGYINDEPYDISIEVGSDLEVDTYQDNDEFWIHHPSFGTWQIKRTLGHRTSAEPSNDQITSPMPGVVIAMHAEIGNQVTVGDPLIMIEAMKMEHIVRARHSGQVARCHVALGANVRAGQLLIEVVEDV